MFDRSFYNYYYKTYYYLVVEYYYDYNNIAANKNIYTFPVNIDGRQHPLRGSNYLRSRKIDGTFANSATSTTGTGTSIGSILNVHPPVVDEVPHY